MKFPIPENLNDFPYAASYLQTFGGNVTDSSAVCPLDSILRPPTGTTRLEPPYGFGMPYERQRYIGRIYADNVQQVRNNDISAYIAAQKQAGAKEIAICIRNATTKDLPVFSRAGIMDAGALPEVIV